MHGLNRIFIMGCLGKSPELQPTKTGKAYVGLSVATQRFKSNTENEGAPTETTDWHYVRVWGTQAETCAKYLTKGAPVFVEGYLSHYSQHKDNGETERKTSINAIKVDFLPRANHPDTPALS